jgi:hypothetical protein
MLLDKKQEVVSTLEAIKKTYLKLVVLKQLQEEACDSGEYRSLHELSCDERVLINDINSNMKYVVPDLVWMKTEADVRELLFEIDELQKSVIKKSLSQQKDLCRRIKDTKRRLDGLGRLPHAGHISVPRIVNIRA